ncbi:MAG: lysylphosphatidylglycerol synthase transmembrane domain-containing protein [archaeon]
MKKRYQIIFVILALSLLYFVLNKVGFRNIWENLMLLKWYYLVLAVGINLLVFMTWNYKWKLLVDKISKVRFWQLFPVLMTGVFFNAATPTANVGGEPLRAYYLGKIFKKDKSKYFATIIIDKITNAGTALIFVLFSVLFIWMFLKTSTTLKIVLQTLVIVAAIVIGIAIFYKKLKFRNTAKVCYPLFKKKFKTKESFLNYAERRKENMFCVLREFYKNRKALTKETGLGILMQIFTFGKAYILFIALGEHVNPLYVILAVSIAVMIGQLIIVPGGIGVVESSMISMYALLGINADVAAMVTILDRVIYYFFALGVGYVMFTYTNYKYSKG